MAVYFGNQEVSINGGITAIYTGAYEATPKANSEQTLETANKYMLSDVTVHAVPYYEVSNVSGETVYIASEV